MSNFLCCILISYFSFDIQPWFLELLREFISFDKNDYTYFAFFVFWRLKTHPKTELWKALTAWHLYVMPHYSFNVCEQDVIWIVIVIPAFVISCKFSFGVAISDCSLLPYKSSPFTPIWFSPSYFQSSDWCREK